ncbi:hypothetical protein HDV57DRAFT_461332 [Trichoderma longibrachiatum]
MYYVEERRLVCAADLNWPIRAQDAAWQAGQAACRKPLQIHTWTGRHWATIRLAWLWYQPGLVVLGLRITNQDWQCLRRGGSNGPAWRSTADALPTASVYTQNFLLWIRRPERRQNTPACETMVAEVSRLTCGLTPPRWGFLCWHGFQDLSPAWVSLKCVQYHGSR